MKHFLYLLFLVLLASCTEHERILPEIEKDQPYYPGKKAQQLWMIDCELAYDDIKFIGDIFLIHTSKPSVEAYRQEDGSLVWETSLSGFGRLRFEDYKTELVGNSIYMIDQKTPMVLILNYETGSIESFKKAVDDDTKLRNSFGVNIIDNDIYFFRYNEPGHFSFYKYNYIQDAGEELVDLVNYKIGYSAGYTCFYDFEKQLFFAELKLENNSELETQIILTIDRNTYDTSVIYEQLIEEDDALILYNDLYIQDDILLTGKNNQGIIGMDITTGEIQWINEEEGYVWNIFGNNNQVFVENGLDLYQIDPKSGQIIWVSPSFSNSSTYQMINNLNSAVTATQNITYDPDIIYWWKEKVIAIYDLHDGQRLVESEIDHPDDSEIYFRAINTHEQDGERFIYVATQSYIYKYSWPL